MSVLARGRGWVAVDKPAGIPTIPDHGGAAHSLIAAAARALAIGPEALHATSRLDREVSGVVVFALDKAAAARLQAARDEHRYVRRYVAIAAHAPEPAEGMWDQPIGRAKDPRHRAVNGRDAVPSRTQYAVVARAGSHVLLALGPVTGRTHQLRVHASHAGAPLLGDRVYGGTPRVTLGNGRVMAFERVALHCAQVTIDVDGGIEGAVTIASPVPEALASVWVALGGEGDAWEKAASWQLPVD